MRFVLIHLSLLPLALFTIGHASAAENTYTNGIGMEFVLIPARSFTMWADKNFDEKRSSE
ncbi:MAG: hypothetical protein LBO64_10490 [Desulfovibrio sp.]|jgi:formylglycine-generating enzyme required for sulfatase activity|nr:hypothetical protein [Desulfovibrio sp.]